MQRYKYYFVKTRNISKIIIECSSHEENFYHTYTLDEAARLAVSLVRGTEVAEATADVDESEFYKAEDKPAFVKSLEK